MIIHKKNKKYKRRPLIDLSATAAGNNKFFFKKFKIIIFLLCEYVVDSINFEIKKGFYRKGTLQFKSLASPC